MTPVEYIRQQFRPDPCSGIADSNLGVVLDGCEGDFHFATSGREFNGVVESRWDISPSPSQLERSVRLSPSLHS